jgi:L-rhamnose mutarotase
MQKTAFKMKLRKGCREEYIRRHDAIWPELKELLSSTGISDYTIFLDNEADTLFAVQRQSDGSSSQELVNEEVVRRWWDHMSDIMETNPDNSPVSSPLEKVFHMD